MLFLWYYDLILNPGFLTWYYLHYHFRQIPFQNVSKLEDQPWRFGRQLEMMPASTYLVPKMTLAKKIRRFTWTFSTTQRKTRNQRRKKWFILSSQMTENIWQILISQKIFNKSQIINPFHNNKFSQNLLFLADNF